MLPTAEQLNDPNFDLERFVIDEVCRRMRKQQADEFVHAFNDLLQLARQKDQSKCPQ